MRRVVVAVVVVVVVVVEVVAVLSLRIEILTWTELSRGKVDRSEGRSQSKRSRT